MLNTLSWALVWASIQIQPLLVALLLPDCPQSALISLLSHTRVLHLTAVPDTLFLDPAFQTDHADPEVLFICHRYHHDGQLEKRLVLYS